MDDNGKLTMENQEIQPSPFDEPDLHRKLALEVEGRKFWVQREILATYSPVFKTMFYGDFAEAKKDLIELKEEKAKDFDEFLRCLIPMPTCKQIDRSNIEIVLHFSRKYQIEELRQKADDYLSLMLERCPKSGQDLLYILPISANWRTTVFEQCLNRCVNEFDLGSLLPIFKDVPDQIKAYLALGGSRCHVKHLGAKLGPCSDHQSKYCIARCPVCSKCFCTDCFGHHAMPVCSGKAKIDEVKKALLDSMYDNV